MSQHAAQHVALTLSLYAFRHSHPFSILLFHPSSVLVFLPYSLQLSDIFNYFIREEREFYYLNIFSSASEMADRDRGDRPQPHQVQIHPQLRGYGGEAGGLKAPQRGPSASQILAVVILLPVGGTLLCLAGLTLAGSLIGLALTTPLFIICSPVLVPAAAMMGFAVIGFLSSGAFGLTGLSSLSWVLNCFRQKVPSVPDQMDYAKRRLQDTAVHLGQKTKEVGERIQTKAQDTGREAGK